MSWYITLHFNLTCGTKIFMNDGEIVEAGQTLAEWDPYNKPIISEVSGIVKFIDLVEGKNFSITNDENTGLTSTVILDYNTNRAKKI